MIIGNVDRSPCRTSAARSRQHPRTLQVEPEEHLRHMGEVGVGLRRARPQDRRVRHPPGHAGTRSRAPRCTAPARRDRTAGIQGVVFRVALVRPGSARQPDQRAPPAGADSLRQGGAGLRLVRSRVAPDSAERRPGVDGGAAGAGGLPVRHRRSLSSAGARPGRQGRAPVVAVEPVLLFAERRLCGVVDGRRQVPDRSPVDGGRSHPDLRAISGDSRHQPQPGRPGGGVCRVPQDLRQQRQHLRDALRRRPAARPVLLTGARLCEHARCGAARQQHPDGGRREPDPGDEGGY